MGWVKGVGGRGLTDHLDLLLDLSHHLREGLGLAHHHGVGLAHRHHVGAKLLRVVILEILAVLGAVENGDLGVGGKGEGGEVVRWRGLLNLRGVLSLLLRDRGREGAAQEAGKTKSVDLHDERVVVGFAGGGGVLRRMGWCVMTLEIEYRWRSDRDILIPVS